MSTMNDRSRARSKHINKKLNISISPTPSSGASSKSPYRSRSASINGTSFTLFYYTIMLVFDHPNIYFSFFNVKFRLGDFIK